MSISESDQQPLLTFTDSEKSPLSIRAKALVFVDERSQQLRDQANQLAGSPLAVLIEGESGTGKELLARHIHRESQRAGLFVSVNCAAISPRWGEAELFGYVPGSYHGGPSSRAGWFGSANGGTLYLDEIADVPQALQVRLLHALQTREVQRFGANSSTPIDVRLVVASSIDLKFAVAAGKFDQRLYDYLLDGHLLLPSLRQRPADILPLAEYFLGVHAQRLGFAIPLISPAAQQRLQRHNWPGNTRELESVIHFALLQTQGDELQAEHLNLPQDDLAQLLARLDDQQRAQLRQLLQG